MRWATQCLFRQGLPAAGSGLVALRPIRTGQLGNVMFRANFGKYFDLVSLFKKNSPLHELFVFENDEFPQSIRFDPKSNTFRTH